jgi:hypothetical protein
MRKRRSDYDSDGLDELLAAQGVEMIAPNRWLTKVSIKERIAELESVKKSGVGECRRLEGCLLRSLLSD